MICKCGYNFCYACGNKFDNTIHFNCKPSNATETNILRYRVDIPRRNNSQRKKKQKKYKK